jgi:hypothetical protein
MDSIYTHTYTQAAPQGADNTYSYNSDNSYGHGHGRSHNSRNRTYIHTEDLPDALCPMCGKFGRVKKKWIPSTYYPRHGSAKCDLLERAERALSKDPSSESNKERVARLRKMVKGTVYRGRSKKHVQASDYPEIVKAEENRKESWYRVTYGKYPYFYIAHYDKEQYNKDMERYHNREINYRPNGKRWCKVSKLFRKCGIVSDPITGKKYIKFKEHYFSISIFGIVSLW